MMHSDLIDQTLMTPDGIERISSRNVEYLCFEGGGGKGVLFLGALQELARQRVLRYSGARLDPNGQIKGIAGSSAGALTAVLLSCGYTPRDLQALLFGSYDFNLFFDQPSQPAKVPGLRGCRSDDHAAWFSQRASRLISVPINRVVAWSASGGAPNDTAVAKLGSRRLLHYLFNLYHHWGIFSGCAAQDLFRTLIARKVVAVRGHPLRGGNDGDITFRQHKQLFGVDLVLTGSNFSTGQTGFFSAETSPNFPVAAAARISMSLPIIFKPMVITAADARRYAAPSGHPRNLSQRDMTGVWVDGGYMNNLPRTAFAHRRGALAKTLCFSLDEYRAAPRRIRSLLDFLGAYASLGLMGTDRKSVV